MRTSGECLLKHLQLTSGSYTSYWNAFLLLLITTHNEVAARKYFHKRVLRILSGGHAWWGGACMVGGVCVVGGHAWQGVCVAGGHVWWAVCIVGGVHGSGDLHGGGDVHSRKNDNCSMLRILLEYILVSLYYLSV